ncbi:tRNA modification GTPase MnmE [Clostridium sp. CAG:273]|nr:tRNA uridine-5-carboxymethylaminomethyl(34) synthesis GTPase MnmE [Clostridia bacterium]CDE84801.1 tRNA modification GTPase MnmE [Clostridium sp. CAG:273]
METIAAISTATGSGGIGIIRMSGDKCFEILKKIFISSQELILEDIKGYTIKYGYIINTETKEKIDEVLVSFFKNPKSYTRENMCEINSHGGIVVERKILEECLKNGAELAEPGEFTKRAFLNGRIDLSQAESVIELINAKSDREAHESLNQLQGELSKKINIIKNKMLDIMADIEASIDYPEYDIEELTEEKTIRVLSEIKEELIKLEESFHTGKLIREGIKTAIIGQPNAGKSSLLNAILKEERAIVSEYAGTTRDTIEEFITIKDIPLKIIDTAGIRDTNNAIEKIGVEKALKIAENADLVIAIIDNSKDLDNEDIKILNIIEDKNAIIVLNKIDKDDKKAENRREIVKTNKPIIKISAVTKEGIEDLYNEIVKMFNINKIEATNDTVITNVRHKNQIDKAVKSINEAINVAKEKQTEDILAIYIKQTLEDLGEITGDNVSEDIINEIFSKFCLGK